MIQLNYNLQIITSFLESQQNRPIQTYRAYKQDCQNLAEYLKQYSLSILKLNSQSEVNKYIAWQKQNSSSSTIRRRMCTLRALIRHCETAGLISSNGSLLKTEEKAENIVCASSEDIQRLFNYCMDMQNDNDYYTIRNKFMILLVIICGFKCSDLVCLKVSDIKEFEITFTNMSGKLKIRIWDRNNIKEQYEIYIRKRSEWLKEYHHSSNKLFVGRFGDIMSTAAIRESYDIVRAFCDISSKTTLSSLRTACIRSYYEQIPDSILVSKIFDISTNRIRKLKCIKEI